MAETQFKLRRAGDIAIVTIDNGADHTKPSTFGRAALESLAATLDELERGSFAAMVLTGKPFVFAVGADIDEFPSTAAEAELASRAGHELFARIRALPFPTVAAINGACLGGGVEMALHCSARTISTAVRHFGFPEVFLGIFPGWGGTQLVPRLVGPKEAVTLVVANPLRQNRLIDGARAFELGFADLLLEPVEFVDESLAFARELAGGAPLERVQPDWSEAETVFRRARNDVEDAVHGAAPAPYVALELLEGARSSTLEEGYRREEEAFGELLAGRQAQASLYAFDAVERRAKKGAGRPEALPRRVEKVGVVGAGLMATQLATVLLKRLGVPLVIRDLDQETVDRALASIRKELGSRWAPMTGTTSAADFAGCDLVIEAVFENLDVKKRVFAELREVVAPECVLATNTSSLSVAEMGADLGIHVFNPVAVMPLVELVRHDRTEDVKLATAWDVVSKLRKRAVLVSDTPGFVVNRVLTRMTRVLMDALEHGTPSEVVDEAILRLGMPMAPSVLLQMVGPHVANQVLETMHAAYPERFPLSPALAALAAGDEPVALADEPWSADEVQERAMDAVADEIHRMLDEGVTAEPADVDACMILGAGWPFFMGGATPFLDATGVSERVFGGTFATMREAATA